MKTALKLPTLALLVATGAMLPAVAQPTRANAAVATPAASPLRPGDHIAAVINQELVTAYEVSQRMGRARDEAQRNNQRLPPDAEFRKQVLESLIEERAMLSHARDGGMKVDEPDIDRAVANMAAQNQMSLAQLRAHAFVSGQGRCHAGRHRHYCRYWADQKSSSHLLLIKDAPWRHA